MNPASHADLGGTPCTERVQPEPEGELFHAAWEPQVLALTLAMGGTGAWNIDASRSARETLPNYRALSYYAIWFEALCRLMLTRGLVNDEELSTGHSAAPAAQLPRRLHAAEVASALARGSPTERPSTQPARFAVGAQVRTRAHAVPHHTRLPAYAAGKLGRIEQVHGMHVFADSHAQGQGEQPQWLYTVVFTGEELWGAGSARPPAAVSIDAWESYLEPA